MEYMIVNGELYHYGVTGMKWGVRRYQKKDGSLTELGKKQYAKAIKKAVKDGSYETRAKVRKEIYEDLTTNHGKALQKDIENLRVKKKAYMDAEAKYEDYWESSQMYEDSAKAYQQTLDYFKKNDKQYLDTIIKNNGGRTDNLDAFHDFRKHYEYYEDAAWTAGEKKFYKDRGIDPKVYNKAYDDYHQACKQVATKILGVYGSTSIAKAYEYDTSSVHTLVSDALRYNLEIPD